MLPPPHMHISETAYPAELYSGRPPSEPVDTSIAAARSMSEHAQTERQRVLDYLLLCPTGATDEEIQGALKMGGNTERPRRRELVLLGHVVNSKCQVRTSTGRMAIVWMAKR